MTDDDAIRALARAAGIAVEWTNAAKERQVVTPAALIPILAALGFPCESPSQLAESRERVALFQCELARRTFLTATAAEPVSLPGERATTARMELEGGATIDLPLQREGHGVSFLAPSEPGYHRLRLEDRVITLAVAPPRCLTPADLVQRPKSWGIAVQLYALRHPGDLGIGDAHGLIAFSERAARSGADAIALSPMHAMFCAEPAHYGPYSPSSRLFLNPLYADPAILFGEERVRAAVQELGLAARATLLESADLIDWPESSTVKLSLLRTLFDAFWGIHAIDELGQSFKSFRARGGALLEKHARFEAIHAFQCRGNSGISRWRSWPRQFRDPDSEQVGQFSQAHTREIAFHIFLQWIADASLAAAQHRARSAGMGIGLIADMAVGMDAGGSHAWSQQRDLVVGLNVGAPPDLFNPQGQDWGLTTFSPQALIASEFGPFLATVRAVLRNAGGMRIDHAMGLARLWLVPEGGAPADGAYLQYPSVDLMRLLQLESHRHRAIIIAEDLGTVPDGFQDQLMNAGIDGIRVLWFERDEDGSFRSPSEWDAQAAAMTTTHDLPTVAGWWSGADIKTRHSFAEQTKADSEEEEKLRATDRAQLWKALRAAGAANGAGPASLPDDVVDAAVRFVADTPSELALLPLEDLLALREQPNIPGTITEHPNWRRRYPAAQTLCSHPEYMRRTGLLRERRGR